MAGSASFSLFWFSGASGGEEAAQSLGASSGKIKEEKRKKLPSITMLIRIKGKILLFLRIFIAPLFSLYFNIFLRKIVNILLEKI